MDPRITANGAAILAMLEAFQSLPSAVLNFMLKHQLATRDSDNRLCVDTERWYPAECFRAIFTQISDEMGPAALYGVGLRIMDNVSWPPGINHLADAIQSADLAYHLNHRKNDVPMADPATGRILEGIGHYRSRRVLGKRQVLMDVDSIYPCDFDRGVLTGIAIHFDARAEVIHDPGAPCRRRGGQSCTYIVTW